MWLIGSNFFTGLLDYSLINVKEGRFKDTKMLSYHILFTPLIHIVTVEGIGNGNNKIIRTCSIFDWSFRLFLRRNWNHRHHTQSVIVEWVANRVVNISGPVRFFLHPLPDIKRSEISIVSALLLICLSVRNVKKDKFEAD